MEKLIKDFIKKSLEEDIGKGDLTSNASISYLYETKGLKNTMTQKHHQTSNNHTQIINKQKFEFYGVMKILKFLNIKGFKKSDFQNHSTHR